MTANVPASASVVGRLRMFRLSAAVVATINVGVAASLAAALAVGPAERSLYSRADILTMVTGEASLRRAYTRQIELPSETCEGGPLTCSVDHTYRQVYALSFAEETVRRGADGKVSVDRRERGRLTIALVLPKEAETRLEDALLAHVSQLGVAEFARPRAGMFFLAAPLDSETLTQSVARAWVCTELDGAYVYDLLIHDGTSYARGAEDAKKACRAIEGAVQSVEPTMFRTMPEIRAQLHRKSASHRPPASKDQG